MTIEAMKQALDALCDFDYDKRQSAITALRAAIEQAEMQGQSLSIKTWQERCEEHPDHNGIVSNRMIQARMQEEIDELREANEAFGKRQEWWNDKMFEMEAELQRYKTSAAMWRNKAYEAAGHPLPWKPDELWQGLTDKDLEELSNAELGSYDLCLEVEAKLKEKNG